MHDCIFNVPHVNLITFTENVQGQLLGMTETLNDSIDEARMKREQIKSLMISSLSLPSKADSSARNG